MSWYSKSWSMRWPVLVDNSGGGTSPVDLSIALPTVWPDFWDRVQSSGADVRVADADGVTLLTYQLNSWNYANQTGTVEVDNYSPPKAGEPFVVWLYFGNAAASSAAGSFTASTPLTGYVHPGAATGPLLTGSPASVGSTEPGQRVQKTSKEITFLWLDLSREMERLPVAHQGSVAFEEVQHLDYEVLNNGTDEASEKNWTELRVLPGSRIRIHHTGGTDGDDRTLSLAVTTTTGRTLNPRVLLNVRDIDEV